ncbi:hypothetical protein H1S01_03310 [Heliobacterium chlorum]|uniref:DUF4926 domain-containing protein n=1 Tax=Heliobacterium chlorum TaxID=2698 RepID=A0ABR7SZV6_HELCL|nr:hypothetical protein [Heliobacterium chlorum]MBC9783540.1 hypothetical protein [Heliobacterium chlorum]
MTKLSQLDSLRGKPVILTYTDGAKLACKPIEYIHDDEITYMVEVLIDDVYPKGQLVEVSEEEIGTIAEVK